MALFCCILFYIEPPHVDITSNMTPITKGSTNLAIDCKATGDQPLDVKWYHNGQLVSKDGKHVILPDNTLLILGVNTALDAGKYECVASNSYGSDNATALGRLNCIDTHSASQTMIFHKSI